MDNIAAFRSIKSVIRLQSVNHVFRQGHFGSHDFPMLTPRHPRCRVIKTENWFSLSVYSAQKQPHTPTAHSRRARVALFTPNADASAIRAPTHIGDLTCLRPAAGGANTHTSGTCGRIRRVMHPNENVSVECVEVAAAAAALQSHARIAYMHIERNSTC